MDTRFPHHRLVTDSIGSYLFICVAFAAIAAFVADAIAAVPTAAVVAAPRAVVVVAADLVAVTIGSMPSSLFTSTLFAPQRLPCTLMLPRGQPPRLPPVSSLGGPRITEACLRMPVRRPRAKWVIKRERGRERARAAATATAAAPATAAAAAAKAAAVRRRRWV
jgi:hypothetical protein